MDTGAGSLFFPQAGKIPGQVSCLDFRGRFQTISPLKLSSGELVQQRLLIIQNADDQFLQRGIKGIEKGLGNACLIDNIHQPDAPEPAL